MMNAACQCHVSAIHGRLLTAWSVAGIIGPQLVSQIRDAQLSRGEPETVKQGWQRHYVKGAAPQGEAASFHLSRRRLKPPRG